VGSIQVLPGSQPAVLAMRYDWTQQLGGLLHNSLRHPAEVTSRPECAARRRVLVISLGDDHSQAAEDASIICSSRHTDILVRVGGLDYLSGAANRDPSRS